MKLQNNFKPNLTSNFPKFPKPQDKSSTTSSCQMALTHFNKSSPFDQDDNSESPSNQIHSDNHQTYAPQLQPNKMQFSTTISNIFPDGKKHNTAPYKTRTSYNKTVFPAGPHNDSIQKFRNRRYSSQNKLSKSYNYQQQLPELLQCDDMIIEGPLNPSNKPKLQNSEQSKVLHQSEKKRLTKILGNCEKSYKNSSIFSKSQSSGNFRSMLESNQSQFYKNNKSFLDDQMSLSTWSHKFQKKLQCDYE